MTVDREFHLTHDRAECGGQKNGVTRFILKIGGLPCRKIEFAIHWSVVPGVEIKLVHAGREILKVVVTIAIGGGDIDGLAVTSQ